VLVPDAPVTLTNDPLVTSSFMIGFNWQDGVSDGGSPVIDYRITYDQSIGNFVTLIEGLYDQVYVTDFELLSGRVYQFKV
jgi:hypothetical protein